MDDPVRHAPTSDKAAVGPLVDLLGCELIVFGVCDVTSAHHLAVALRRMERRCDEFTVELSKVTFADSTGLEPLVESVRRCRANGRADPRLRKLGPAVLRVFEILEVHTDPFDLAAWDAYDDPAHRAGAWGGRR